MKLKYLTLALMAAVAGGIVIPGTVVAAPCPVVGPCGGTNNFGVSQVAIAFYPTVCTVNNVTAWYFCGDATKALGSSSLFLASWPNTALRTQDSTGGGIFSCNGGATRCKVGNDGLPVELLHFNVE